MTRKDLACLCLFLLGFALFLYGSNYYNAIVGWAGVSLILCGIFAEIFLQVYEVVRKRGSTQKP
ncbi:MAG: hypothetical protein ACPLZC_03430 [Candidatus Bathyarchaeales archaeon]